MFWPFPTKSTTPGQFLVFVVFLAVILLLVGAYLVYLSFGQPPEKLAMAMQARSLGVKLIAAATALGTLAGLGKRFLE